MLLLWMAAMTAARTTVRTSMGDVSGSAGRTDTAVSGSAGRIGTATGSAGWGGTT